MVGQSQMLALAPGIARTDRSGRKTATAGRADVVQHCFNTSGAIGAFIGADTGISGLRWQIAIAKLAVWAQFQQGNLLAR